MQSRGYLKVNTFSTGLRFRVKCKNKKRGESSFSHFSLDWNLVIIFNTSKNS